jgi:transcriptional regulator with XRE-family HTH domain
MEKYRNDKLVERVIMVIMQLREEKGITQAQLYRDISVHISRIENSKRDISVSTLGAITDYLDIKLSDFFKLVEKQK